LTFCIHVFASGVSRHWPKATEAQTASFPYMRATSSGVSRAVGLSAPKLVNENPSTPT